MAGSTATLLQFALDASADNYPVSVTWTAGEWVHVIVWANEAACTTTLLDDLGNTFPFIGSEREAAINTRVHHYYGQISTGGAATLTARWFSDTTPFGALAVINRQIVVKKLAGVNGFQAGSQADVFSSNPTSPVTASTTSQPAYLSMLGVNMQSGTFTANTGAGWTDEGFVTGSGGGGSLDARAQGKSVATVGSQTGTLVNASSDRGVAVMAIFTEAILAPTYLQQPTNATVQGSEPIAFVAQVTNPDTFQWYDNSGGSFAPISGETQTSLTFQATAAMNGRQFYVIATNAGGSLQSSTATLTYVAASVPKTRTPYENLPRGGADAWDDSQGGVVLTGDAFDADVTTGTISATTTEANDIGASTATAALVASLAKTEANDTLAATATAALVASATITEANDTLAATVTSAAAGLTVDAAITEANDTASSTATAALVASAAITEANDTATATATAALVASATITEANDTASSTATAALVASATSTEANDTASSTATAALVASATITEANDTASSTATAALVASATITEANDTATATVGSLVGISATITEADDTATATATAALVASVTITEADDVATSTVTAALVASATITEADDTASSTVVLVPFSVISAAITEADDTATSTAAAGLTASLSATDGDDSLAASATLALVLNANATDAGDVLVSRVDTGTGGGATPEEVWNYVLSNGLTAGETLAQALAHATNCCG